MEMLHAKLCESPELEDSANRAVLNVTGTTGASRGLSLRYTRDCIFNQFRPAGRLISGGSFLALERSSSVARHSRIRSTTVICVRRNRSEEHTSELQSRQYLVC